MNQKTAIITKIDNLLNCDFEPHFEIKPITDLLIGDGSLHYRMSKGDNFVDFGVFSGEMAAYMWECPGEGRVFLKALEEYANEKKLKLHLQLNQVVGLNGLRINPILIVIQQNQQN